MTSGMRADLGQNGKVKVEAAFEERIAPGGSGRQSLAATNWLALSINVEIQCEIEGSELRYTNSPPGRWTASLRLNPQMSGLPDTRTDFAEVSHCLNACLQGKTHGVILTGTFRQTPVGPQQDLGSRVLTTPC